MRRPSTLAAAAETVPAISAFGDLGEQRPHLDNVVDRDVPRRQGPGHRRLDLEVELRGADDHDRLTGRNHVADILQPFDDHALGDLGAERGDNQFHHPINPRGLSVVPIHATLYPLTFVYANEQKSASPFSDRAGPGRREKDMPKELVIDPGAMRKRGEIAFAGIPVKHYDTPFAEERRQRGDAGL